MNINSANKYLFTLYRRLAIKFDQYLQHLCVISNIDECKHIFSNNSSTIMGSKIFGIYFSKPSNISELFNGKVGEMTSEHVTAYFGNAVGCDLLQTVEYMEFRCESLCNLITYPADFPQLCDDIPANTTRSDAVVRIKDVVTYYRDFYQYMAKKYYCYSEKSYDNYCKEDCCSENIKYCSEIKKCGCNNNSYSNCNSGCNTNCQIECKMKCDIECTGKCNNNHHCKPKCDHRHSCKPKCDNYCKSKPYEYSNNWICRKC